MNKIEREYNKNKQSIRVEEEFDFNDFVNSIVRFAAKYNVDISDVGIDKRVVDDYDDTRVELKFHTYRYETMDEYLARRQTTP